MSLLFAEFFFPFRSLQESYQKAFAVMKPDKRLQWLPNMGSVEVDIEMDDRSYNLEVTPAQAVVLELFQEKGLSLFTLLLLKRH